MAAAASVKVYGSPSSAEVSRVLACLFEKDIEFQLIRVDLYKGHLKMPEFLKLQQPLGQVTAVQDEDKTLFESRSICRYISEKYADRGNKKLYGKGTLERALIEQWLQAEEQTFDPPSSALVFHLAFAPALNVRQDLDLVERSKTTLLEVLDVYDKRLGESEYLAGDDFTLADLSHLPNAHHIVHSTDKRHLIESKKNVSRWWEAISNRPSWKRVIELRNEPPPKLA
ncbi:Glutathione S-transferase F11 [Acorus gramineus]|uniref:glutathione transferase n=1 Tax=Acorus gramineus TaxID=55184 RepID=A0AAV9AAX2_ACOGR|nr:Glutathione S-transferase F11 [Acorus gramineus]